MGEVVAALLVGSFMLGKLSFSSDEEAIWLYSSVISFGKEDKIRREGCSQGKV
jgi:hypothetical protein